MTNTTIAILKASAIRRGISHMGGSRGGGRLKLNMFFSRLKNVYYLNNSFNWSNPVGMTPTIARSKLVSKWQKWETIVPRTTWNNQIKKNILNNHLSSLTTISSQGIGTENRFFTGGLMNSLPITQMSIVIIETPMESPEALGTSLIRAPYVWKYFLF